MRNKAIKAAKKNEKSFLDAVQKMKATGFASPSEDYTEPRLNIHHKLVQNDCATFFIEIDSAHHQSEDYCFQIGDILVIDRGLEISKTCYFIGIHEDNFALFYKQEKKITHLKSGQSISENTLEYWGRVTSVIHKMP